MSPYLPSQGHNHTLFLFCLPSQGGRSCGCLSLTQVLLLLSWLSAVSHWAARLPTSYFTVEGFSVSLFSHSHNSACSFSNSMESCLSMAARKELQCLGYLIFSPMSRGGHLDGSFLLETVFTYSPISQGHYYWAETL